MIWFVAGFASRTFRDRVTVTVTETETVTVTVTVCPSDRDRDRDRKFGEANIFAISVELTGLVA